MAKFKVGDRVRRTRDLVGCYADIKNPCVVTAVFDDGAFIDVDDLFGHTFNGGYVYNYELELAPNARFQVVCVDDFVCDFDTQEAAEENARELAKKGGNVAVYKLVATAAPAEVAFERLA